VTPSYLSRSMPPRPAPALDSATAGAAPSSPLVAPSRQHRRLQSMFTPLARWGPTRSQRRSRRWSVRAACVAVAAVAVAAAVATAADEQDGDAVAFSQTASASRQAPSVLPFPVGDRMPEGRWASACSLTCILPGVNDTRTVMDSQFKIGADVCVAHVGSAAATLGPENAAIHADQALKLAVGDMNTERGRSASRVPEPIVTYKSHAAQDATRPHCAMGSRLVNGLPWWPEHPHLLPIATDDVTNENQQLVADEAMVFGALTMGRNVLGGSLQRQVGAYDLVAASVQRLGVCVDSLCFMLAAVDTTRPSAPVARCVEGSSAEGGSGVSNVTNDSPAQCTAINVNMPIITHLGLDGVERPVSMASADLLTLGRGMLGSPRWFQRAGQAFHLGGEVTMSGPTLPVPKKAHRGLLSIQDGMEVTTWDLNGTAQGIGVSDDKESTDDSLPASPTSTPFLAHIATIFCAGKLQSFLSSPAACNGVRPWGRVRRPSASAEIQGNIMDAGVWAGAGKVVWKVNPTRLTASVTGSAPSLSSYPYQRRPWMLHEMPSDVVVAMGDSVGPQIAPPELLGRPSREINPSSAIEGALATSLFQRQLSLPAAVVAGHASSTSSDLDAAAAVSHLSGASVELAREVDRLSHAYDRRVFQEEHPAPPVSSADLVMAVIVVVPELGALLVLLLTTERWGRAALLGFATIVILGAVSISGVIALASQEAAGAAWRARSTRTATHAFFPAGSPVDQFGVPILTGTLVVVDESFLLLAPTMYRPLWVWRVSAAVCGVYVLAAAAMAARVLFVAGQQRRVIRDAVETPPSGAAREALPRARRWWRPQACDNSQGAIEGSRFGHDIGDGGGTTAAEARRSSGVGAASPGAGVPPCPISAGGVPRLPR